MTYFKPWLTIVWKNAGDLLTNNVLDWCGLKNHVETFDQRKLGAKREGFMVHQGLLQRALSHSVIVMYIGA